MSEPPTRLLNAITIQGFLSFADDAAEFALTPLSVLIGPNGAGKSNLVEAVSVLRSVPRDLPRPIREGGRVRDWLWKPDPACAAGGSRDTARIEIVFAEGRVSQHRSNPAVRYRLVFGAEGDSFVVLDERVENVGKPPGKVIIQLTQDGKAVSMAVWNSSPTRSSSEPLPR